MTLQIFTSLKILILLINLCPDVSPLVYKDLEDLGVACPPSDTCNSRKQTEISICRSCECDDKCAKFGTCCIDSPKRDDTLNNKTTQVCTHVPSMNTSFFMITKCSSLWDGLPKIKELCEGDQLPHPLTRIPVTSPSTGVTYANVFCAICNKDEEKLTQWSFSVTPKDQLSQNLRQCGDITPRILEYRNVTGHFSWGYWHMYNNYKKFVSVNLQVDAPRYITSIRECLLGAVSQCADNWTDEKVRRKCEIYMAAIEVPLESENHHSRTFKNAHCAICNYITDFKSSTCKQIEGLGRLSKETLMLQDIMNLKYSYRFPSDSCLKHLAGARDQPIPDCENLICEPGYQIEDRRCQVIFSPNMGSGAFLPMHLTDEDISIFNNPSGYFKRVLRLSLNSYNLQRK